MRARGPAADAGGVPDAAGRTRCRGGGDQDADRRRRSRTATAPRQGRSDSSFRNARTALLDKQREIERLTRHMATLPSRRDAFKDRLIEVLRADYDDTAWQAALDRARRLMEAEA